MRIESDFFPMFVNLKGKKCLVIGAGNIAYRKIKTLLKYGARIIVVARQLSDNNIKNIKGLEIHTREFNQSDLEDVFLVVAATDDKEFNRYVFELCNNKNILVNNMTSKADMNARFAAVYQDEDVQVAVSAKGYPKKSVEIRDRIKNMLKK